MKAYVNIRLNGAVCKSCCDRDDRGCCGADVLAGVSVEFWPYSHLFKQRVLAPEVFERAREHNLAPLASAQTDAAGRAASEFEIEKVSSLAVIVRLEGTQPAAIVLGVIRQASARSLKTIVKATTASRIAPLGTSSFANSSSGACSATPKPGNSSSRQ
jgi:hypothetical protein